MPWTPKNTIKFYIFVHLHKVLALSYKLTFFYNLYIESKAYLSRHSLITTPPLLKQFSPWQLYALQGFITCFIPGVNETGQPAT